MRQWVGVKNARLHHRTLGLAVRALENIGVLKDGELQLSKPEFGENHEMRGFLDAFYDPQFEEEQLPDEDDKRSVRSWTKELFKDTLARAKIIITTCSNSGNGLIRKHYHPRYVIIDEAAMAKESETILSLYQSRTSMDHVTLIGDPKQLCPTVISKYRHVDDDKDRPMINKYAEQMEISLVTRLYDNNYPTFMLAEQHRMTEGISDCSNVINYKGAVQNAPGTAIVERSAAQATIEFLQREHRLTTTVPHMFLNVSDGVCIRMSTQSRINLHNIVVDLNTVERLVESDVFTTKEISVCTPYKEQVNAIRRAIHAASKSEFWSDRRIFDLDIRTTDSFQGDENRCIILDLVLARERRGGVGFVSSPGRLNVGTTRARDAFFVVGDMECLEDDGGQQSLEEAEEEPNDEEEENAPTSWGNAGLRKVLEYYQKVGVVIPSVKHHLVSQRAYVPMEKVQEYFKMKAQLEDKENPCCRNCRQPGHEAETCTNEKVAVINTQSKKCNDFDHFSKDCTHPVWRLAIVVVVGCLAMSAKTVPRNHSPRATSVDKSDMRLLSARVPIDVPADVVIWLVTRKKSVLKRNTFSYPDKASTRAQREASRAENAEVTTKSTGKGGGIPELQQLIDQNEATYNWEKVTQLAGDDVVGDAGGQKNPLNGSGW